MAKKRLVSGLTLLFLEETQNDKKNSGNIGNGGAKLENSDTTETKKEPESVVEEEEKEKGISTTEENAMSYFVMPLHYPSFTKKDYEVMPQWNLDQLFTEYGLSVDGDLDYKRKFAMGAFLWPETGKCEKPEVSPMHGCQESSPMSKKAKMVEFLRHLLGFA